MHIAVGFWLADNRDKEARRNNSARDCSVIQVSGEFSIDKNDNRYYEGTLSCGSGRTFHGRIPCNFHKAHQQKQKYAFIYICEEFNTLYYVTNNILIHYCGGNYIIGRTKCMTLYYDDADKKFHGYYEHDNAPYACLYTTNLWNPKCFTEITNYSGDVEIWDRGLCVARGQDIFSSGFVKARPGIHSGKCEQNTSISSPQDNKSDFSSVRAYFNDLASIKLDDQWIDASEIVTGLDKMAYYIRPPALVGHPFLPQVLTELIAANIAVM